MIADSPTKISHAIRGSIMSMRDAKSLIYHEDGALAWDSAGCIVCCDTWEKIAATIPEHLCEDWRGHLITPGFVDCHVHLPQLDCRNKTGHTLLDWLQHYIYPAEAAFADSVLARDTARRFYQELLKNGTTTAMIYSTIHEEATHIAFEEAEVAGVRAIIGKVMMDRNSPIALLEKTGESLAATERLISKWHGKLGRLFYAVTPRFALTCSKALLMEAGKMSQNAGCYFQTHLAETPDEVALAHDMFGVKDYVGLYKDCHCLGHKSIYAHCIYLSDGEWKQLSQSHSSVAHCPSSNIFLKSGRMPFEKISEFSVRCGLGSDVGAGPEFSLWDVMQCGRDIHSDGVFSSQEAFYRATLGGAEALEFERHVGSFHVGKDADIAVFKASHNDIQSGRIPNAVATYIKGKCCYQESE